LISVGALTHSAPALDISLDLDLSGAAHNPLGKELDRESAVP